MNDIVDIHFFGDTVCDLHPLSFGHRRCEKGYPRPIEINTDCYKLHYIASGKGVFEKNGEIFPVQSGHLFISKPNEIFNFKADQVDPFHYIWISFNGKTAKRLDPLPTIAEVNGAPFVDMINGSITEEHVMGQLYLIINELTAETDKSNDYVSIIKNYVRDNESGNVTVEQIRKHLNLNRQYMSALFKSKTGITLQDYIISSRIDRAKLLLIKGYTVSETATLCEYSSVYAFSKAFKKVIGVPPTAFIKNKTKAQAEIL